MGREKDLQHSERNGERLARGDGEGVSAEEKDTRETEGKGWVGARLDCLLLLGLKPLLAEGYL